MYCVHNGKCSVMVFDTDKGKYVYIPEKNWHKLTIEQRKKYRISHVHENTQFEQAMINA